MSLTFLQLAQKVLEEEKRPLSPDEIWISAQSKGYDKEVGTKGKTPARSIGARLYVDVRDNPNTVFAKTETQPTRFVLRSLVSGQEKVILVAPQAPANQVQQPGYLEKALHPFMGYYGHYYLKAYLKTLHHNKSGKKEFGEWVHPDMVGCYFPFADWEDEVIEVSSLMGNTAIKLFSFELKRDLDFSNLREAFFQAVSNSSWANEGYLAAAVISTNDEFLHELKRLSTSFGIGVVKINIENPDETDIIFPARTKDTLDWENINKLTMNPDFKDFLQRISIDISSREVRQEKYDPLLTKDELVKSIHQKNLL